MTDRLQYVAENTDAYKPITIISKIDETIVEIPAYFLHTQLLFINFFSLIPLFNEYIYKIR